MITREKALAYHAEGKPGKLEVIPTKPTSTQEDLSLAYSPGVAEPDAITSTPVDHEPRAQPRRRGPSR